MAHRIEEVEPPSVKLVATCRNVECDAAGKPNVGNYYANAAPPIYRGNCMVCSQPITDLVPYEEPAP